LRQLSEFTGLNADFEQQVFQSKRLILDRSLISELNALAHRLKEIAASTREGQDFTFRQLHAVLRELIVAFPVYRTYAEDDTKELPKNQRGYVELAAQRASDPQTRLDPVVRDFVRSLLLVKAPSDLDPQGHRRARDVVMRFQQLTGPVMAKGLEDTAFYSSFLFASLNEVGGQPARFGTSPQEVHRYHTEMLHRWPHTLLATATHDTKRGEDVRARLNVLSELPDAWRAAVQRWREMNLPLREPLEHGELAPSANDEYLFYKTLVGAWITGAEHHVTQLLSLQERIKAYMLKAIKESKAHTSWTEPNTAYESATEHFVTNVLQPSPPGSSKTSQLSTSISPFSASSIRFLKCLLRPRRPGSPISTRELNCGISTL
jgi:(1->4)-alpha-D-glucan 1-alpha-D-glucosylmutase